MPRTPPPRLELSLPKIVAGALAAASAAVASSWLGVAGTVLGTIIVSVIATVGTALYSNSLERSHYVIKETLPVLATRSRAGREQDDHETREIGVVSAKGLADAAPSPLRAATTTMTREQAAAVALGTRPVARPVGSVRRGVSWPTVLVSCLATLVMGFGMLTGFEALVGRSAAELTGSGSGSGTTLGSLIGSHRTGGQTPKQPVDSTPTTTGPTTSPTPTSPTEPTSPTGPTSPTSPTSPTGPTSTGPTSTEPTSPSFTDPTGSDQGASGMTAAPSGALA